MSFGEGLAFFARKLWWWMAHHPASLVAHGSALRKVRLFEWLALAFTATHMGWLLWRHGWAALKQRVPTSSVAYPGEETHKESALRQGIVWVLLCALGSALLVQLLPILYNSRYSSALLDPFLMLLTGFNVAYLTHPYQFAGSWQRTHFNVGLASRIQISGVRARLWPGVLVVPALLLLSSLVFNTVRRYEVVAIDPEHLGSYRIRMALPGNTLLSANGMEQQPDGKWRMTESPAALVIPVLAEQVAALQRPAFLNAIWEIGLSVSPPKKGRCRAEVAYTQPATTNPWQRRSWLRLNADSQTHLYELHANAELRPGAAGDLRIAFHCPAGTLVQWDGTRLLESTYTEKAQQRLMHPEQ